MNNKFRVNTLIQKNHKFCNDFVRGKISGIGFMICNSENGYASKETENGYIYTNDFTVDEYDKFMKIIDKLYPDLCIFNY